MSKASITFLGTGTSVGAPVIGCSCAVCTSSDPKDQRLRSSVLYQGAEASLLVDSGPDLRQQALRYRVSAVDAVFYTHCHLDHVSGFDELRAFCWKREEPLPMYGNRQCLDELKRMYAWAFSPKNEYKGYVKPGPVVLEGEVEVNGVRVNPLPVVHGSVETVGYLFRSSGPRSIAYFSDVKEIPKGTMDRIKGVDVLVVDALRNTPHPTHFSTEEALAAIEEVGAAEAWLTHLGCENLYADLEAATPDHVHVAWDGMRLEL